MDIDLVKGVLEKEKFSFNMQSVHNRKEFMHALQHATPDIVLADYSLPGINGLEAVQLKNKVNPEVPLVIISGKIGEEIAVDCIKKGANDYILKDKLFRLIPVIRRVIKESSLLKKEKYFKQKENIFSQKAQLSSRFSQELLEKSMDFSEETLYQLITDKVREMVGPALFLSPFSIPPKIQLPLNLFPVLMILLSKHCLS